MAQNASAQLRASPFARATAVSQNASNPGSRPKSGLISPSSSNMTSHNRHQSYSPMTTPVLSNGTTHSRHRSESKISTTKSNTFAPSFIKTEELQRRTETINGIEGENDFSGKRYVWLKDPVTAFVRGWIVEELENGQLLVQCDDGSVRAITFPLRGLANRRHSNERLMARMLTKLIQRSLTRPTIWLS